MHYKIHYHKLHLLHGLFLQPIFLTFFCCDNFFKIGIGNYQLYLLCITYSFIKYVSVRMLYYKVAIYTISFIIKVCITFLYINDTVVMYFCNKWYFNTYT